MSSAGKSSGPRALRAAVVVDDLVDDGQERAQDGLGP